MLVLHAQPYAEALHQYANEVLLNAQQVPLAPIGASATAPLTAAQVENMAITAGAHQRLLDVPRVSTTLHEAATVFVNEAGGIYSFYAPALEVAEKRVEAAVQLFVQHSIAALTSVRYAADRKRLYAVPRVRAALDDLVVPPPGDVEAWAQAKQGLESAEATYQKLNAAATAALAELVAAPAVKPPYKDTEALLAALVNRVGASSAALDAELREHYMYVLRTLHEVSVQEQRSLIPSATQQLDAIWADMLDAYRAQLGQLNSVADLQQSVAVEVARRLTHSSEVLEAYRSAMPLLPAAIDGAPKKRTLAAIMDTQSGRELVHWYYLFLPVMQKQMPRLPFLNDATLRSFAATQVPFEDALRDPMDLVHFRLSERSAIGSLTLGRSDASLDSAYAYLKAREEYVKTRRAIPDEFGAMETSTLDKLADAAAEARAASRKGRRGPLDPGPRGGGGGGPGDGGGGGGPDGGSGTVLAAGAPPSSEKDVAAVAKHVEDTRKQRDKAAVAAQLALQATDADTAKSAAKTAEQASKAATAAAQRARATAGALSATDPARAQAVADGDTALAAAGEASADAAVARQRADTLAAEEKQRADADKAREREESRAGRTEQSAADKARSDAERAAKKLDQQAKKLRDSTARAEQEQVKAETALVRARQAQEGAANTTVLRVAEQALDIARAADKEARHASTAAEAAAILVATEAAPITDATLRAEAATLHQRAQTAASVARAASEQTAAALDYVKARIKTLQETAKAAQLAETLRGRAERQLARATERAEAAVKRAADTGATREDLARLAVLQKQEALLRNIETAARDASNALIDVDTARAESMRRFYELPRNPTAEQLGAVGAAVAAQRSAADRANQRVQTAWANMAQYVNTAQADPELADLRNDLQQYNEFTRSAAEQAIDAATQVGTVLDNVQRWRREVEQARRQRPERDVEAEAAEQRRGEVRRTASALANVMNGIGETLDRADQYAQRSIEMQLNSEIILATQQLKEARGMVRTLRQLSTLETDAAQRQVLDEALQITNNEIDDYELRLGRLSQQLNVIRAEQQLEQQRQRAAARQFVQQQQQQGGAPPPP